eukprot:504023-Pelagomonas_calceolata.AAC.6
MKEQGLWQKYGGCRNMQTRRTRGKKNWRRKSGWDGSVQQVTVADAGREQGEEASDHSPVGKSAHTTQNLLASTQKHFG